MGSFGDYTTNDDSGSEWGPINMYKIINNDNMSSSSNNSNNNSSNDNNVGGSIPGINQNEGVPEESNPFQGRPRLTRSPPALETSEQRQITPRRKLAGNDGPSTFSKLGEEITTLTDMLEDGKRRSIHQAMRDAISNIKTLYDLLVSERGIKETNEKERRSASSQTSPLVKGVLEEKRKKKRNREEPNPKKHKAGPTESAEMQGRSKHPEATGAIDEGQWIVATKAKKRRPKEKRHRPDAIVIETKDQTSYADILRQMKADPKLGEMGQVVSRIRRTQKGGLLIQLNQANDKTEELKTKIGECVGNHASVKSLTQQKVIEIKDLDEVSSENDIREAIVAHFKIETGPDAVLSVRKAYGGTQTAIVRVSARDAKRLLEAGKVKIGWVNCRIRERVGLTRCFKCLEFGHISKECKSKEDRSSRCRRCGENGHIAKDCAKDPMCMFCIGDGVEKAGHIAGSGKCPLFRKALAARNTR